MANNSGVNLDISNLTVGFSIRGGTTKRTLTVNGSGNTTLTSQQSIVLTLPNRATDTVVGYGDYSAKGVILVGTAANTFTALAVGTDNFVLTAASGQSSGMQWAAPVYTKLPFSDTSGSATMTTNNGYFVTTTATPTLPAAPANGDVVSFVVLTSASCTITANTGQKIQLGTSLSATAGTAATSVGGNTLYLTYRSTGAIWWASAPQGSWTIT